MQKLILFFLFGVAPTFAENHGVLRIVHGDVKVISSKTGKSSSAQLDQNIMVRDVIETGADGMAKAIMDDNTAFTVGPSSKVEIRQYISVSQAERNALFNVREGRVRFDVRQKYDGTKNKFMVATPVAVCGVRGTDFVVAFDANSKKSGVTTFKGLVEFGKLGANGEILNPVRIGAGKSSEAGADGQPSRPEKLSSTDLEKLRSDSDIKDKENSKHDVGPKNKAKEKALHR